MLAFHPQGGTAIVPEGVPKGHPAYGLPVGSRYPIRFGRWPGSNIVFDKLPQPAQISGILAHDDYAGFTQDRSRWPRPRVFDRSGISSRIGRRLP
ncbi:MAG TPA: hypothetical protein VE155_04080 [Pseudonocardiaceae bacterium]|nr:hypothetical protein [Pseudonocardiaceae bacterium]